MDLSVSANATKSGLFAGIQICFIRSLQYIIQGDVCQKEMLCEKAAAEDPFPTNTIWLLYTVKWHIFDTHQPVFNIIFCKKELNEINLFYNHFVL